MFGGCESPIASNHSTKFGWSIADGLGLIVNRIHGSLELLRVRVGRYPIVSLADAREQARDILRKVELGLPLVEPQVEEEEVTTLGSVIPDFIRLYAKPRNRDWKGTESVLTKFASLNDRPIDQIKRRDVVKVLDEIVASGTPFRANRALAAIKKLMNWCLDRGVIEANVLAGLQPPTKEVARDRVLSDDELRACWAAADEEGFPFGSCTKLMILTGQRRSEVAGMRWSEVDLAKAIWTIPARRAKNATLHVVPLAPTAVELLKATPRFLQSDLVFTTNGRTAVSGFGRVKRRLDGAVQSETWRFHEASPSPSRKLLGDNPATWAGPLPVRQWLVQDVVPMNKVTGLYGDGGTGKTLLAIQLAVAVVTGGTFLDMPVRRGRAFLLLAENDRDDSHLTLDAICSSLGLTLAELGEMRIASRAGLDNVLMAPTQFDFKATPLFQELLQEVTDFQPTLVVLDTAADLFGGNENDRVQVRRFLSECCTQLAIATGAAVARTLQWLQALPSRKRCPSSGHGRATERPALHVDQGRSRV